MVRLGHCNIAMISCLRSYQRRAYELAGATLGQILKPTHTMMYSKDAQEIYFGAIRSTNTRDIMHNWRSQVAGRFRAPFAVSKEHGNTDDSELFSSLEIMLLTLGTNRIKRKRSCLEKETTETLTSPSYFTCSGALLTPLFLSFKAL